jgi:octaprenyl-diphosphate synthase
MSAYLLKPNNGEPASGPTAIIAPQLELVERTLEHVVASDVSTASELALHLFSAGGKRIRPALLILSALASGGDPEDDRFIRLAAAAELVHTASLIHDDVVDKTTERRGRSTANGIWGNRASVLGGDYLVSKAFTVLAGVGDTEIMEVLSAAAVRMTESEMLQAESEGSMQLWEANYWRIIGGKTAAFMGVCCECGAMAGLASVQVRRALLDYGTALGLAFQITDDLLDMSGDPAISGKDTGTDLTHGKFTLPVLLAIRDCGNEDREPLRTVLKKGRLTSEEAREAADVVISCGAAETARQSALGYVESACSCLEVLPKSDYAGALNALARSIVDRES